MKIITITISTTIVQRCLLIHYVCPRRSPTDKPCISLIFLWITAASRGTGLLKAFLPSKLAEFIIVQNVLGPWVK